MAEALREAGLDQLNPIGKPVSVLLGDRKEMLLAALERKAARRLVHIAGGETFYGMQGSPDHAYRNAISHLSDLHCVANDHARINLQEMGIPYNKIHVTGLPSLDALMRDAQARPANVKREARVILAYHPDPQLPVEHAGDELARIIEALEALGLPVLVSGCNDDGNWRVVAELLLNALSRNADTWEAMPPNASRALAYHESRMRNAYTTYALGVGNSSAFRIEASIYGLPVVEVGSRQLGRLLPRNIRCAPTAASSLQMLALFKHQIGMQFEPHPLWAHSDGAASKAIVHCVSKWLGLDTSTNGEQS